VVQKLFFLQKFLPSILSGGVNTLQHKKFWKKYCSGVLFSQRILPEVVVIHQSWAMSAE